MFRLICITLLTALLCLASCSSGKSTLSTEADRKAQEYFERTVAKCGDSYYAKVRWSDIDTTNLRIIPHETLLQLKDPFVTVKEKTLTEADKLNGIEWEGWIIFVTSAYKEHNDFQNSWSNWSDGVPKHISIIPIIGGKPMLDRTFSKKNGRWSIDEPDKSPSRIKPACSELPLN